MWIVGLVFRKTRNRRYRQRKRAVRAELELSTDQLRFQVRESSVAQRFIQVGDEIRARRIVALRPNRQRHCRDFAIHPDHEREINRVVGGVAEDAVGRNRRARGDGEDRGARHRGRDHLQRRHTLDQRTELDAVTDQLARHTGGKPRRGQRVVKVDDEICARRIVALHRRGQRHCRGFAIHPDHEREINRVGGGIAEDAVRRNRCAGGDGEDREARHRRRDHLQRRHTLDQRTEPDAATDQFAGHPRRQTRRRQRGIEVLHEVRSVSVVPLCFLTDGNLQLLAIHVQGHFDANRRRRAVEVPATRRRVQGRRQRARRTEKTEARVQRNGAHAGIHHGEANAVRDELRLNPRPKSRHDERGIQVIDQIRSDRIVALHVTAEGDRRRLAVQLEHEQHGAQQRCRRIQRRSHWVHKLSIHRSRDTGGQREPRADATPAIE